MVRRVLVTVTAIMVLLGGLVLPTATATTWSSISITSAVHPAKVMAFDQGPPSQPTAMPGDEVVLAGSVTRSSGRVVLLQRLVAGVWREVDRSPVTGSSWRFSTVDGAPARSSYRALALRTRTAGGATSATRAVTVVRPTLSVSTATTVETGRVATFTGTAAPARRGRPVQLWELRGPRWVVVADTTQSSVGTFTMRQLAASPGQHTYRAVTLAGNGRFDVRSRSRDLTTVRPSTPGARSVYLADVTPVAVNYTGPRQVQTVAVGGHLYVKSIKSLDHRLTWQLGDGFQSLATALVMQTPATSDPLLNRNGPRLVEVRVDAALRLRRFIKPGQVVPLSLDLRGKHTLDIASYDRGDGDADFGGALTLITPVVTTVPRTERGVDTSTALSELRPAARTGPVSTNRVLGHLTSTLYGGSFTVSSGPSPMTVVGTVDYDLGGSFTTLTGVPLIYGEAFAGTTGRVHVYGDGVLLATLEGAFEERAAAVDVTGVHRLRVELVTDPTPDMWIYPWGVGLADPRLG